jgi:predicted component of type VI protein secretion system
MKLSLVVLTPGKMQGKAIAISTPPFLIGRDAECHLRPASPLISKKHCALIVRGDAMFVQDFGSTNGTLVNGQKVVDELECKHEDVLQVGPLEFRVQIVACDPERPTPPPRSQQPHSAAEEAAGALLLALGDDGTTNAPMDAEGVPMGSTVMQTVQLPGNNEPAPAGAQNPDNPKGKGELMAKAKAHEANTSSAAKAILEKYLRRPRN